MQTGAFHRLQLWPNLLPRPVEPERALFLHPFEELRGLRVGHERASLGCGSGDSVVVCESL